MSSRTLALAALVLVAACASGQSAAPDDDPTPEGAGGDGAGGASGGASSAGKAGSGTAGSSTAGNGASGSGTAGSGTSGSSTAGSGTSGSGTSGSGTSGSGTSGSGTSGSGTSGSGTSGSGTSGSGTSGSGTSGSGTAGAGAAGSGTAGSGTTGACGDGTVQTGEACDDGNTASGDGCSSTCQWETDCGSKNPHQTIACGETRSGSFSGTYSDVKNTICGKTFLYQDLVFVFTAQASGTVTLTYAAMPDPNDGAIFVMRGSCHSKLCVGDSTSDGQRHDVTFTAEAGVTYYIDLEAPSQQPSFNLTLSCP